MELNKRNAIASEVPITDLDQVKSISLLQINLRFNIFAIPLFVTTFGYWQLHDIIGFSSGLFLV